MRKVAVLLAAVTLSGCGANVSYIMNNYQGIEPVDFSVAEADTYRIFDKPDQRMMMITSSLSSAMGVAPSEASLWELLRPRLQSRFSNVQRKNTSHLQDGPAASSMAIC
jgi:hypothetical protein